MPRRKTPRPTRARPGTEEKIAELTRRLANKEELWHDLDAGMDDLRECRVPIVSDGNFKLVGWRVLDEVVYRRRGKKFGKFG